MKHFLFEFITGGGLTGQTLPDSLIREGRIMVKTILKELIACGNTKITITKDCRVESFSQDITEETINIPLEEILYKLIKKSDICSYTELLVNMDASKACSASTLLGAILRSFSFSLNFLISEVIFCLKGVLYHNITSFLFIDL